jgi:hypothetical protein
MKKAIAALSRHQSLPLVLSISALSHLVGTLSLNFATGLAA